jgi:2'-5' RNA ligase
VRLFVAVYPPEPALDHLAEAIARLRLGAADAAGTNVRLAARPLWHVTLAFLGEVDDSRVAGAAPALEAGVSGWLAAGTTAPALRLTGGGRFGRRRFTVLWTGLAGDVEGLRELSHEVRRALRRARLAPDRKPFRPHLTFARPGDRLPAEDLAADLAALAGYEGPPWRLDAVHLVASTLGAKPVHERIATVGLAGTSRAGGEGGGS